MKKEKELGFEQVMAMKDKRRLSRGRNSKEYEKSQKRKDKSRKHNLKNAYYDSYNDDY